MTVTTTPRPATAAAVAAVLVSSAATVLAVLYSPWGSVFVLDDMFGTGDVVAPVLAGAFVGTLQSAAFVRRLVLITVVALPTFVFVYPAAMHLIGVALGTVIGPRLRPTVPVPAVLAALLTVTTVAGSLALVRATMPEAPLLVMDEGSGRPIVVLDPQRRAPEILDAATGVLVDAGGCLGLRRDGAPPDADPLVIFWRDDIVVRDAPFGVAVEGTAYGLGDRITVQAALLERRLGPTDYAEDLPGACMPFDVLMT